MTDQDFQEWVRKFTTALEDAPHHKWNGILTQLLEDFWNETIEDYESQRDYPGEDN